MQKLLSILFSNKISGLLLILFAASMAVATFIENDFGTETARSLVYNAKWFELLIVLLAINFMGNIAKYNLFSRQKAPVLLLHLAFIVIILGAGITKYRGYEALMTIKEGEANDTMLSIDSFIQLETSNGHINNHYISSAMNMSELGFNHFSKNITLDTTQVEVLLDSYIPRAKYTLQTVDKGKTYLHIVISENEKRKDFYIEKGTTESIYGIPIAFETHSHIPNSILIKQQNDQWVASFPEDTNYFSMIKNKSSYYPKNSFSPLEFKALSTINDIPIVFNTVIDHGNRQLISKERNPEEKNEESAVVLDVKVGDKIQKVTLFGGKGYLNPPTPIFLNGIFLSMRYGSKPIKLPFSIFLKDFILERYPGSESPSGFYSKVQVQEEKRFFDKTIFMNNVLNHQGFRFFQSAYLPDESGTILSINHDRWGTLVTYIGYALLGLGMMTSLFWKNSYFSIIAKQTS